MGGLVHVCKQMNCKRERERERMDEMEDELCWGWGWGWLVGFANAGSGGSWPKGWVAVTGPPPSIYTHISRFIVIIITIIIIIIIILSSVYFQTLLIMSIVCTFLCLSVSLSLSLSQDFFSTISWVRNPIFTPLYYSLHISYFTHHYILGSKPNLHNSLLLSRYLLFH